MKLSAIVMMPVMVLGLNAANASEYDYIEQENERYCIEQAEQSGIEDVMEKNQYAEECIESLRQGSGDNPNTEPSIEQN